MDDKCMYCVTLHIICMCKLWGRIRDVTYNKLEMEISAKDMITTMLKFEENWEQVHNMVKVTMKNKGGRKYVWQASEVFPSIVQ